MTELRSLIGYIQIMYDDGQLMSIESAQEVLDQCLDDTLVVLASTKVKSREQLVSILEPVLTPGMAKIQRPDIYDTLVLCNNNTEVADPRTKLSLLVDERRSIFVDKPSKGKEVDLFGYFGSPEINDVLQGRTFDYMVMGFCPWLVYQDQDTAEAIPSVVKSIRSTLNPRGKLVIVTYKTKGNIQSDQGNPDTAEKALKYRDIFKSSIESLGFVSTTSDAVPFISKKGKGSVLSSILVFEKQ